ncbi:hypothetical protein [Spirillospora sp. NPDC047279]|uniref:hypothetical protein n=1 Tax=Spirillospora sp. NPDC047279 TaxID=3155478 RepID=UPI0033DD0883
MNETEGPVPITRRLASRPLTWLAAAVVAAVLLLAWACRPGSSGPDAADLPAPRTLPADPVPAGPVVTRLPARCGVSPATIEALVPGARVENDGDFGECRWHAPGSGASLKVVLTAFLDPAVGITAPPEQATLGRPPRPPAAPNTATSYGQVRAVPAAVAVTHLTDGLYSDIAPEVVTGLGDEAVGQYDRSQGVVRIRVRAGDVVASLDHHWGASPGGRRDPAGPRRDTLRAAADVARSLGAPPRGTPAFGPAETGRPLLNLPADVCALVPKAVLDKVIGDRGSPLRGRGHVAPTAVKGARNGECSWRTGRRALDVTVQAVPDVGAFGGVRTAGREYLKLHLNARGEEPLGTGGEKYFAALPGPGDQAFAAYVQGGAPGRVVFRHRNLLVEAVYTAGDPGEPLTRRQTVNGAYAVAVEIARRLPR